MKPCVSFKKGINYAVTRQPQHLHPGQYWNSDAIHDAGGSASIDTLTFSSVLFI